MRQVPNLGTLNHVREALVGCTAYKEAWGHTWEAHTDISRGDRALPRGGAHWSDPGDHVPPWPGCLLGPRP